MKKIYLALAFLAFAAYGFGQNPSPDKKFSPQQLKDDLAFVKRQIYNVHANPFNRVPNQDYEKSFSYLASRLTDSLTATEFYKYIKGTLGWLDDEHAGFSIKPALQTDDYKNGTTWLPLTLAQKGNKYYVNEVLIPNTGLQRGMRIQKVNGDWVEQAVGKASGNATGYAGQQRQKALDQFGYLYSITPRQAWYQFVVETADGKKIKVPGVQLKVWQDYVTAQSGHKDDDRITYTRYGNNAYINVPAFDARTDKEMDSLKNVFTKMFMQIKADEAKAVFIDVSKNGGGNSAVGDLLTSFFYGKPYNGYQCNFRRSDEYLALITSWGIKDPAYAAYPVGTLIHSDSEKEYPFNPNPARYNGKVYIIVGNGTFSSAIMFATTIKDNHIATLIGQVPPDGHPNHFGELYNTTLPNTKIDLRFGVKEWIRPEGKQGKNILQPDILVDVNRSPEEIIKQVVK